jgi:hypothetical protein
MPLMLASWLAPADWAAAAMEARPQMGAISASAVQTAR